MSRLERGEEADDTALARFMLVLRSKGLTDPRLLDAFESVPRGVFLPLIRPGLLYLPISLPLPCGEEALDAPTLARLIALLGVQPGQRIAEIGCGSGFVSALLARLGAEVLAFERYRTLAVGAERALRTLRIGGVHIRQADGLARGAITAPVDRILLHGALASAPAHLFEALVPGGIALGFRQVGQQADLVLWRKDRAGGIDSERLGPMRIGALRGGVAQAL